MLDRTRIGCQVWHIAKQYNITMTSVHDIINSYIAYCKGLVAKGERVELFGLVSIVPDVITSDYTTTLAFECEKVADLLALPQHTVYVVIKAYIEDAINSVLSGKVAEIRGLVVVKPIRENGEITKIHSNVSQSLKNVFLETDSVVTSVRVHTYKSLRDRLCTD